MVTTAAPITSYEDLTDYFLDDDDLELLLGAATECVLNWSTAEGWPIGVVHSFVRDDHGHFWLTCATRRKRVSAIRRDNRVSIVINGTGTPAGAGRTATFKGTAVIHEPGDAGWAEVSRWFYPALCARVRPDDVEGQRQFLRFLDSPGRVILEVTPTWKLTFDGAKMGQATEQSIRSGAR